MQWPPLPDYGCFQRWPQNGQSFIHPDDVPIALKFLPSSRVLKRVKFDGTYYHYRYGKVQFRLRPAMWSSVKPEGVDMGDRVETIGVGFERDRFVATVWGMYYVTRKGCILYRLRRGQQVVPNLFSGKQLRVLTEKATIRPGNTVYPEPTWDGRGETLSDVSLDE